MRTRRIGAAFRPGTPAAKREPFPGMNFDIGNVAADNARGGAISFCVHALLFLLLLSLAWWFPAIREEILPVQIVKEAAPPPPPPPPEPEPPPEAKKPEQPAPAPAPKALAERKSLDFKPQAQAVAPSIINPTVIQQAAPSVAAQKIQMNEVAAVVAPKDIAHATVVAERATAIDSVATAQVAKIDLGAAAAPALRGQTNAALPTGASAGPKQVVAQGNTTGTGSAVNLGNGSSVREGIASGRDVLGVPDGAPLANVNTKVGTGFLRGEGGNGTGGEGGVPLDDCLKRPEVSSYLEQVRSRMYQRWNLPGDAPSGQKVLLKFKLDASGSVMSSELEMASDAGVGATALEALRSAAPFAAMPDRVRCLARQGLKGTFTVPSATN
ncbi:MAG TPA: energy transducer TonB [Myxococcota bacterium]|nr:energy transducer TonB [Myxococcota bacterium]